MSAQVMVSPYWLNDVMESGAMVDPGLHRLYRPLPSCTPIAACAGLRVCVSGFRGEQRSLCIRLIQAIGATYTAALMRDNHVLMVSAPEGAKYDKAVEWGIPVVRHCGTISLHTHTHISAVFCFVRVNTNRVAYVLTVLVWR